MLRSGLDGSCERLWSLLDGRYDVAYQHSRQKDYCPTCRRSEIPARRAPLREARTPTEARYRLSYEPGPQDEADTHCVAIRAGSV